MNPVDIFGSGACAVTLVFFAFIGIGRSIGAFVEKYPPLEYAGNGTLSLLLVHLSKGLVYWVLIGEAALWIAAFLADQWGVLV
jgi:hypothetical protein